MKILEELLRCNDTKKWRLDSSNMKKWRRLQFYATITIASATQELEQSHQSSTTRMQSFDFLSLADDEGQLKGDLC